MSLRIAGQKVLAIVLAGGKGSRLAPLTTERAKPAVPFLGTYRLIDFPLSNLVHSGIGDVWVIEQYLPHGLNDHLSGGRPWDLDRTRGGLVVMPPFSSPENEDGEFAQGNAHALAQHVRLMREFAPDVVLVMSADHIYKLDYSDVIREHVRRGASVTMVTTELADPAQATRFGNVRADAEGRVTEFAYKPEEPLGKTVTAEVFVYGAALLMDTLEELERQGELGDYGEELLPALVARGDAYAHPMEGYWMDVGTLDAYMQTHQDFLDGRGFVLDTPEWPFITSSIAWPPTRIHGSAHLDHAFVCGGATIQGEVVGSVIGPNAVVEKGASVRDSIVQAGAVVRAGASVRSAIVDAHAVVEAGARVGGQGQGSPLSVIGAHSVVEAGAQVGPGVIVEPRQTVRAGHEAHSVLAAQADDRAGK
ncbi:glucose-1-phosphate adenylyltransferase family protein [Deinococcus budaensis]|uniref:Glucose-1-phosphate adenylyltransferase n=1 Tax=Deinococcus budaensis TaxID=1665626 RepID=A0A7W8GE41_9DEIO|nr:glucose-1-phosphate adenylyltransferase family protein [Deinococcus budaensis]MBB5233684.1 glucose-1-phosphate adenylyltransferase [Deinococcus budaensis]